MVNYENTQSFVEIGIVRRGKKFFVTVQDNIAAHEVGPFLTREEAQRIVDHLTVEALKLGGAHQSKNCAA